MINSKEFQMKRFQEINNAYLCLIMTLEMVLN